MNIIHGADSVQSSAREIALWFSDEDLAQWEPALQKWIVDPALIQWKYLETINLKIESRIFVSVQYSSLLFWQDPMYAIK